MNIYAKIEDKESRRVSIGTGTNTAFYESIGMTLMDVEQGCDGNWYVTGYAPKQPFSEFRTIALSRIDFATSAAILAGFEYTIDNETLYFSYDSFDQQNFADTANGALLALQNVEGVPTSVTWNGYRNHTKEQKGELVRLTLDVTKFLDLYVKGALAHKDTQMELGGKRKAIISNCTTVESIEMYMKSWYGE